MKECFLRPVSKRKNVSRNIFARDLLEKVKLFVKEWFLRPIDKRKQALERKFLETCERKKTC